MTSKIVEQEFQIPNFIPGTLVREPNNGMVVLVTANQGTHFYGTVIVQGKDTVGVGTTATLLKSAFVAFKGQILLEQ